MTENKFCPECGIGLSNVEMQLRFCQNCKANWEPEENMPHEYSTVKCDLCSHEWVAVRPEGTEKLECPNCSHICHFENINP